MADVTASMQTLDLSTAHDSPVRGRHVWKLQGLLDLWLRSGDEDPVPTPLVTDGVAGSVTRTALLGFQRAFGLTDDAVAGPRTWQALFEFDIAGGG